MSYTFTAAQKQALNDYIEALKPGWIGLFFYYLLPYRKKTVFYNLQHVFADVLTREQIVKLAQGFYRHLGLSLYELISGVLIPARFKDESIELHNKHIIYDAIAADRQIVLLTGHFGNWEIAATRSSKQMAIERRYYIIRKKLKNRFVQNYLYKKSVESGIHVINSDNMKRRLTEVLKEKASLIFVMDQRAGIPDNKGIPVEFFGTEVGTYHGMAKIVNRTQALVVPFSAYRKANGQHVAQYHPPLEWQDYADPQQAIYENTRRYNQELEKIILKHPDQWLWTHKRWRDAISP